MKDETGQRSRGEEQFCLSTLLTGRFLEPYPVFADDCEYGQEIS
jgi:hypothetical protein